MKQFRFRALTCLTLAATAATANADLIISEVVDGTLPGGTPKFVELTNTGAADIDLSNYSFGNMNNGGTNLGGGSASQLAGILAPGASYVIGYDSDNDPFNSVYGFDADFLMGGGFVNGDDTLILFQGIGTGDGTNTTIVDIFGVIGTDGSGEAWEYTDSYAYRLGTSPNNGVLDTNDWFIAGANALEAGCGGDDACETINLQTLTTPGTHGAPSAGPDECSGATAISGDGVYAFDATSATTGAEGQNEALCYNFGSSAIENDVWFEWTCAADGTVTVSTCDDASADTRLAAYDGAGCPSDGSAIACNDDASGCSGFTSLISFAGTSGSVYMIQVGHFPGTAGGTGNITVTTTAPPTGPNPDNCDEATAIAG
ncbi:MAG: lamin tail domain-containing protein, partial [Planctomycetes bacterium]|nr:lamin tail domain-containing protein [Planctomycetota bacterium]